MIAAELAGVTRRFGPVTALDRVSFAVREGEVVALLGPNGAGKSTALGILLGLRRPDAGAARLFGADPRRPDARRVLGVTPQEIGFPPTLRVGELVDLVRTHFESPLPRGVVVERFGLARLAGRQVGGLSGGERRRLGVALAFAGAPRLVVLDEPTTGLDREARLAVWEAIRSPARVGGTILLTTHYLDEAEALARRVVLIESGRVVADGSVAAIKAAAGLAVVRFHAPPGVEVDGARREGTFLLIVTADPGGTVERLVHAGVRLDGLEVRPVSLEEAVAARTAASARTAAHGPASSCELEACR